MISKNLYDSLLSIVENADIHNYYSVFAYMKESNGTYKLAKNIVTYMENSSKIWGKGTKRLVEETAGVFKYKYKILYKINTTIETYGTNADENMNRIVRVLNNNEDNFIDYDLGFSRYGNVDNLNFLENGDFKNRLSINIDFIYENIFINSNAEDLITSAIYELQEA